MLYSDLASEIIYNKYKQEKTCGIIEEDKSFGLQKIAEPVGILAGIVPTTNPTSTAIFKTLIWEKWKELVLMNLFLLKNCLLF